ncbi:hypothetical protein HKX48_000882 [Thoreauomyces humboldtii]|nr:hypothetical protein HKX48_000882 [Thoreauomyces humboldtii]
MSLIPVLIRRRAFKTTLEKEFGVTSDGKLRRRMRGYEDELHISDFAVTSDDEELRGDHVYEEFPKSDDQNESGEDESWAKTAEESHHLTSIPNGQHHVVRSTIQWGGAADMILIPTFYFGAQLLVFFFIRTYLLFRPAITAHVASIVNLWWFAGWNAVLTFNQVGMTLLDDGLAHFGNEPVLLAFLCIPLVIGNTGFSAIMRAMIVALEWFARRRGDNDSARVYRYLLKYPRRW